MIGVGISFAGFCVALYGAFTPQSSKTGHLVIWAMVGVFGCLTVKYILEIIGG